MRHRNIHIAKLLKEGGNVILLDEPTNDLDVDTLRALEDALLNFAGCAVVISHDRWFLDRICTHMLAFEGDSHVEWFEGNFEDYEADKIRRLGEPDPHQIQEVRPITVIAVVAVAGHPATACHIRGKPAYAVPRGGLSFSMVKIIPSSNWSRSGRADGPFDTAISSAVPSGRRQKTPGSAKFRSVSLSESGSLT